MRNIVKLWLKKAVVPSTQSKKAEISQSPLLHSDKAWEATCVIKPQPRRWQFPCLWDNKAGVRSVSNFLESWFGIQNKRQVNFRLHGTLKKLKKLKNIYAKIFQNYTKSFSFIEFINIPKYLKTHSNKKERYLCF